MAVRGDLHQARGRRSRTTRRCGALARYGADAGLARDLYVQMCLHCKEMLTDGFVPAEEIGLLVYPLDPEHGNQLAKQLASVGLIKEVSKDEAQGWQVLALREAERHQGGRRTTVPGARRGRSHGGHQEPQTPCSAHI